MELLYKSCSTYEMVKTTGKPRSLIGMVFPSGMADGLVPEFRLNDELLIKDHSMNKMF